MARGGALVSSNAGIHDWPQLKEGLFEYDQNTPLIDRIEEVLRTSPERMHEKSVTARRVSRELNKETVDQWVDILKRYGYKRSVTETER